MPSSEKVDATHAPERGGELDKVFVQSTANLSPPEFFLGKVRTGHMRWMNECARTRFFFFFFSIVAGGKAKSRQQKNNEQHKQGAQRPAQRGVRTAQHPSQLPGNSQPAHISAPSAGCSLLTALWLARHSCKKNVGNLNEATTPARKKDKNDQTASRAHVAPNK